MKGSVIIAGSLKVLGGTEGLQKVLRMPNQFLLQA